MTFETDAEIEAVFAHVPEDRRPFALAYCIRRYVERHPNAATADIAEMTNAQLEADPWLVINRISELAPGTTNPS